MMKNNNNNKSLCDEEDALPDVSFNSSDCQSNQNLFGNSLKLV
jgi:hypothetical protein